MLTGRVTPVQTYADVTARYAYLWRFSRAASYCPGLARGCGGLCHVPNCKKCVVFTAGLTAVVSNGTDPFSIRRVPDFPMLFQFRIKYHFQKYFSVVATTTKYSESLAEIVKMGDDACRIGSDPTRNGGDCLSCTTAASRVLW